MATSPRRARARGAKGKREQRRPKGGSALLLFLLFGAAPIGVAIYFFLQPPEVREQVLARIPPGVAGRALTAGACLGLLIVLAKIALPAFHGASKALQGFLAAIRARGKVLRVLLFPVEFVTYLLWMLVQVLYALDALAIIVAALGALLFAIRILQPEFLVDVVPPLVLDSAPGVE